MTTHGWNFGVSDIANLPTSETDTGKVLAPDGSGGLTWVTPTPGVTDHGALTGLLDDDHTGYLLATGTRTGATSQRQTFTNAVDTSAFYEIGAVKTIHVPGTHNVFLGALTGGSVTGTDNAGIGYSALASLDAGNFNAAFGSQALFANTTGTSNAAIGYQALYSNTTGSYNAAIGYLAGRYHADGVTALQDPENSIYIGYNAQGKDNADSNSIVIGYQAIGKGANTVVLGNTSHTATYLYGVLTLVSNISLTAANIVTDTTTGIKIGTATTQKLGFWNATPVVQPSAYTQTYSTADKTLVAYTADDESAAYTGIDNAQAGTVYAQLTDLNALRTAYETLRAFTEDGMKMLNSVVDDLQTIGLVG